MAKSETIATLLTRAGKATKDGEWLIACDTYQHILRRFPANKRAKQRLEALRPVALPELLKLARIAQSERRWSDAEQYFAAASKIAPDRLTIGLALAATQLELRRAPAALKTVEEILKRAPGNPEALNYKGRALRWMGQGNAAEDCFLSALGHGVTDVLTLNNLGILARAQGNRRVAADYYRRAIAIDPKNIALHQNLALETTYKGGETHLDEMRALLSATGQNHPDKPALYFALFKALDDLGERAEAFSHLQMGNQLTKAALEYDFQKDAIPSVLSKVLLKGPVCGADESEGLRPIFVTGLPRSGTTLVERILSRTKGVQPCGELTVVQLAVVQLLRDVMERATKALTNDDFAGLGREIRKSLAEYSDGSPVLIDKMPLNFRWIGFICAALPEARIVHVSREPMALAWSMYRQSFDGAGNGFVYDLEDIARFLVLHRDLMAHWRACFPGRIFELEYEELVTDPCTVTRNLAKATELEWSPDWLRPEHATNQVLTASAEQVRRPIYRDSNEQWKNYATQLAPMMKALSSSGLI